MARPDAGWKDEEIERWIGILLRAGVVVAAIVALTGGVFYVLHYGTTTVSYATFHGVPQGLNSIHGVVSGALTLHSRWIIQLGLLLLIATPVARVALSLGAFALQRDRTYIVVTGIVLGLLLYSLFGIGV